MSDSGVRETVEELRRAFDERFAKPPTAIAEPQEKILLLRAGGRPLALRPEEARGLQRCPRITPLPTAAPGLLGLVGVRRSIVAAYDLASLSGLRERSEPRWLVLCGSGRAVGLVFDAVDSYAAVSAAAFRRVDGAQADDPVTSVVEIAGETRPVLAVGALLDIVQRRAGVLAAEEE